MHCGETMNQSVSIVGVGMFILFIGAVAWFMRSDMTERSVVPVESEVVAETVTDNPVLTGVEGAMPTTVPLSRATERVTKKPFGIYIDPRTSPVQPEKFRGYHTGADFEAFPEEVAIDVPVLALCTGAIVEKRRSTGYGGVLVTECVLEGKKVTVLYGHLRLASIEKRVGQSIERGEVLGVLGTGGSAETDGERKHLHLSIHLGSTVNMLGYVESAEKLSAWLDPYPFATMPL